MLVIQNFKFDRPLLTYLCMFSILVSYIKRLTPIYMPNKFSVTVQYDALNNSNRLDIRFDSFDSIPSESVSFI